MDTAEADPSRREQMRTRLCEPYRTPIATFATRRVTGTGRRTVSSVRIRLDQFRELFGDDRVDYASSLQAHYNGIDDGSWSDSHLSFYATAHPWEDYAESFAHVLHTSDMVETAVAEGFIVGEFRSLTDIFERWQPLTVSLNEMARSMGTPELYPFAPRAAALRKMMFVYDVINSSRGARRSGS